MSMPHALADFCISAANAKINIIYLHGVDSIQPGDLELKNRTVLKKISEKFSAHIALPRSAQKCQDGQSLCWNPQIDSSENTNFLLESAIKQSQSCIQPDLPILLLGFSSGGYLANKIIRYQIPHQFYGIISVGAGGDFRSSDPEPLSDPTPLHFLLAESEITRANAEALYKNFLAKGANVYWQTYLGEHELDHQALQNVFMRLIKP